jgi:serine/threonine protein phosphatase PrpC/CRP-like cAMP-binding protein
VQRVKLEHAGQSDQGRVRKNNEDAMLLDPELRLFVVADGMGGAKAGEVASRAALDALRAGVSKRATEMDALDARGESWQVQGLLEQAVQEACAEVHRIASADPDLAGMGTTLTAAWFSERRAVVAHVGDSRAYLVRGTECHQLTEDHSLVKELLRQGRITDAEVQSFPYPNALTRAVGPQPVVEVDTLDVELEAGDRFLLCSDGLHRYTTEESLAVAVRAESGVEEIAADLVRTANGAGGADNITVIVVDAGDLAGREGQAQRKIETFRSMPLFRYLTYKELSQVIGATTMRHYAPGQTIFEEGTAGYELFVILSGRVSLRKADLRLAELVSGGHFGEMSLIDQDRRSATAVAEEPAHLLVLPRRKFYLLLRKEPQLAVKLLWNFLQVLSGRLRQANETLKVRGLPYEAEDTSPVGEGTDDQTDTVPELPAIRPRIDDRQ